MTRTLFFMSLLALAGCGNLTFSVGISAGDKELTEKTVHEDPDAGNTKVAIIDMTGMILNGPKPALLSQGENPVALLTEQLNKAAKDSDVKAVVLRINSPGGTVTATDIMYREVLRFKETTGKPVLVLMMDVAASGGYYLACAGDYVIAYPSTITGSIGVYIQTVSFKPAMDRLGVTAEAITSGKNKAAGSPFALMSEDHRLVLRGLVDDFYARFRSVVKQARPKIPAEKFEDITDGRVVSGDDALELGLVDQVGDLHDAFAKAKSMAKVNGAQMVLYHRPLNFVASPYALAPGVAPSDASHALGAPQINLLQINLGGIPGEANVGFYYLWQPSLP